MLQMSAEACVVSRIKHPLFLHNADKKLKGPTNYHKILQYQILEKPIQEFCSSYMHKGNTSVQCLKGNLHMNANMSEKQVIKAIK
jgi:hypothetical protein